MCDLCERVFYRLRNKIYLKSCVRHCVLCGKTSIVVTGPLPTTVTTGQRLWNQVAELTSYTLILKKLLTKYLIGDY